MPSDSEVIITDEFGDSGSANQHTVRHKVVLPVNAARQLLKKKSICQQFPRTILPVVALAMSLILAIIICIIFETWWSSKESELGFKPHSKGKPKILHKLIARFCSEDYNYHVNMVNYINDPKNKATWKVRINQK